jgi:hypothetical protein
VVLWQRFILHRAVADLELVHRKGGAIGQASAAIHHPAHVDAALEGQAAQSSRQFYSSWLETPLESAGAEVHSLQRPLCAQPILLSRSFGPPR